MSPATPTLRTAVVMEQSPRLSLGLGAGIDTYHVDFLDPCAQLFPA
jgi:hypothetical protein